MKRLLTPLLTAAFMLTSMVAAQAQRNLGSHDFAAALWNSSGERCIVCHTPHFADISVNAAPLWNHEITASVFNTYNSSTFQGNGGAAAPQPDGISKLCLSCHDGSVALENFGGATGGTNFIAATADLTNDVSDDHPVSFVYDATLATTDGELEDPETVASGLGGTIEADMLFGPTGSATLECASCHDVHDGAATKFLLKDNAGSALCRTCHIK